MEDKKITFHFDGIDWEKDTAVSNQEFVKYTFTKNTELDLATIYTNPIEYMENLVKNLAFLANLGYLEKAFVWDAYPIIKVKKNEEGHIDYMDIAFFAHLFNPILWPYKYLDTGYKHNIENKVSFYIPDSSKEICRIRITPPFDLKNVAFKEIHYFIRGGEASFVYAKGSHFFSRIEGSLILSTDKADTMNWMISESPYRSIKYNIIRYALSICEGKLNRKFPEVFKDPNRWDYNAKISANTKNPIGYAESNVFQIDFYMSFTNTTDGISIYGFSEYYDEAPRFDFVRKNPDYTYNPLSSLIFDLPENYTQDMEEKLNVYLAMRFSNFRIPREDRIFVLPYAFHPTNTTDRIHENSSQSIHQTLFMEQTTSLVFFTGNTFQEDKKFIKDTNGYIPNIYVRVKSKGFLKNLFSDENCVFEEYFFDNSIWSNAFKCFVKIQDFDIPDLSKKSMDNEHRDSKYREILNGIAQTIKNTLREHPEWDYIPLQGYDILQHENDDILPSNAASKDRIECMIQMIKNQEISRYTLVWGDISKIDNDPDWKQIHNHPVFPIGGRCLWIFT